ncbi:hypothetical protein ACHQM5_024140 [Ranunculus cassubicifolius]
MCLRALDIFSIMYCYGPNKPFQQPQPTKEKHVAQTKKSANVQKGPNRPFQPQAKEKSLAELLKAPTQSSQAKAKPPVSRSQSQMNLKKVQGQAPIKRKPAPEGFGVYICPNTGDNYYKAP